MQKLINDVIEWGASKGILESSDPQSQFLKTLEELGEVASAVGKRDLAEIKDGIGDVMVTVILYDKLLGITLAPIEGSSSLDLENEEIVAQVAVLVAAIPLAKNIERLLDVSFNLMYALDALARKHNSTLQECLQGAYDIISKRTGRMVNGIFVKDRTGDTEEHN